MTMITPSYLGETIEYSSLHACRSTLEDPTTASIGITTNGGRGHSREDGRGRPEPTQGPEDDQNGDAGGRHHETEADTPAARYFGGRISHGEV